MLGELNNILEIIFSLPTKDQIENMTAEETGALINKAFSEELPDFENRLRQDREDLLRLKEKAKGPVSSNARKQQRMKQRAKKETTSEE